MDIIKGYYRYHHRAREGANEWVSEGVTERKRERKRITTLTLMHQDRRSEYARNANSGLLLVEEDREEEEPTDKRREIARELGLVRGTRKRRLQNPDYQTPSEMRFMDFRLLLRKIETPTRRRKKDEDRRLLTTLWSAVSFRRRVLSVQVGTRLLIEGVVQKWNGLRRLPTTLLSLSLSFYSRLSYTSKYCRFARLPVLYSNTWRICTLRVVACHHCVYEKEREREKALAMLPYSLRTYSSTLLEATLLSVPTAYPTY